MSEERSGFEPSRLGSWMGDYQDLVSHEGGEALADGAEGEGKVTHLHIRKRWNPITYRCAYCNASFKSRAMIRRHLERHAEERAAQVAEPGEKAA